MLMSPHFIICRWPQQTHRILIGSSTTGIWNTPISVPCCHPSKKREKIPPCDLKRKFNWFYPRLLLVFGYCCACRSLCVRLSVNPEDVRALTHHLFKLEPPNSDKRRKTPCLRALLIISSEGSGYYGFMSNQLDACRNRVNATTQKPLNGLFSNLVHVLVEVVRWTD